MGYNLIPDTLLNQPPMLSATPRSRFLVLSCWCLPERRWGGLFTLSTRRLAFYTGMDAEQVEADLPKVPAELLVWDGERELLWLPAATSADLERSVSGKQLKGLVQNVLQAPCCDLRARVTSFLLSRATAAQQPHLRQLSEPLPIPLHTHLPIPLSDAPVSVCVDVPVDYERVNAGLAAWNRTLAGTRHTLTQEQVDAMPDEFIATLAGPEQVEQAARAIRRNRWLREESRSTGFMWAMKPANLTRLLAGEWPPDVPDKVPPAQREQSNPEPMPAGLGDGPPMSLREFLPKQGGAK